MATDLRTLRATIPSPDFSMSYTSREGERITLKVGTIFQVYDRFHKEPTGKGILFLVHGQGQEPIRGNQVYERILRQDAIDELNQAKENQDDAETFRQTIESLLNE